tara:strand:+ start:193 stop:327 length:135 start_codon:yes stop_codon:yes gene_type:complete
VITQIKATKLILIPMPPKKEEGFIPTKYIINIEKMMITPRSEVD